MTLSTQALHPLTQALRECTPSTQALRFPPPRNDPEVQSGIRDCTKRSDLVDDADEPEEMSHRDFMVAERVKNMIDKAKARGEDVDLLKDVALSGGVTGSILIHAMPAAHALALSQKAATMSAMNVTQRIREATEARERHLTADQHLLLERVRVAEKVHFEAVALLRSEHSDHLRDQQKHFVAVELGKSKNKAALTQARREVRAKLLYSDDALQFRKSEQELNHVLANALKDATNGCLHLLDEIPVRSSTRQVAADCNLFAPMRENTAELLRARAQHENAPYSLARLLDIAGVLKIPLHMRYGRKVSLEVKEDESFNAMSGAKAVDFFRHLLGFEKSLETCHCGWTLAHYLADAMSYSSLAAHALRALATKSEFDFEIRETINERVTGSQPTGTGVAFGWTALHFVCDGSDRSLQKADIAKLLIARKADIEAELPSGTTPVLQAAATGIVDVLQVLVAAGADYNKTRRPAHPQEYGKPILQMAEDNSSEMYYAVSALPDLVGNVSL